MTLAREKYQNAQENGKQAEARVGSVLRGGFVFGDEFYFCSTRYECVPLSGVRELRAELGLVNGSTGA